MDFLDPRKERAQIIRLIIGYVLIGIAILFGTLILLYQAYGFGIGKDGEVIQNGLVFLSSQPSQAEIYLDDKLYKSATNTKLQLPEGQYKAEIRRAGYTSWQRIITVEGRSLQHFDYPKLFPSSLVTTTLKAYPASPGLATQSPDRRWLLVQQAASPLAFDEYDLADPAKVSTAATTISLPESLVTNAKTGTHSYKLVEWSTDNRRLVMQHTYQIEGTAAAASEYIMLDRQTPADSLNLTRTLSLAAGKQLELRDKKYNQYYVYDTTAKTLGTTTIDAGGTVTPLLEQVLAYKSYGANIVLYMTEAGAPAGQVTSVLLDNGKSYRIRDHGASPPYLVDLATYKDDWFVVVGASGDNKVYVYKNPQPIRRASETAVLTPVRIMRLIQPQEISFSSSTQFILAENATSIVTYDAEYDKGYTFTSKYPLDNPAAKPAWMDGQRLTYVSGGKVVALDYDNINGHTLSASSPAFTPFFDRNYETLYTLAPSANGAVNLQTTRLLSPADQ